MTNSTSDKLVNDQRLVDIETRVAYQEDLIEALNQRIIQHQSQLEGMELICRELLKRLADLSKGEEAPVSPRDDLPPHY